VIHEVAVDPSVAAGWGDPQESRYYYDKFGLGTPRVISAFPPKWPRRVLAAAREAAVSDLDLTRLTELLHRLTERAVRRDGPYQGATWLEAAEIEHGARPFLSIVSAANPRSNAAVIAPDACRAGEPLWDVATGAVVPRDATELARALGPLLRAATSWVIVDPYLQPDRAPSTNTLRQLVTEGERNRLTPLKRLELHTSGKPALGTPAHAQDGFIRRVKPFLPAADVKRIVCWEQRSSTERPHNRYVLTELGGVFLSHGVDESPGDTLDVNVLARDQYEQRWSEYCGDTPRFPALGSSSSKLRGRWLGGRRKHREGGSAAGGRVARHVRICREADVGVLQR
jgi:hypothetical protein